MVTLSKISEWLEAPLIGEDQQIAGVSIDSRSVLPGELFVAIPGQRVDGHTFLQVVEDRGAAGALVDRVVQIALPRISVQNTVLGLGQLAVRHRQQFRALTVAITGSCGKTTVKEMLASILRERGPVLATRGNLNTEVGVPLTLLRMDPFYKMAVIEMGARRSGDIGYLMGLVEPDISVITNVAPAHLAMFGSEEGIAIAKSEIFQHLKPEGIAVLNVDDPYAAYWQKVVGHRQILSFGMEAPAEITCRESVFDALKTQTTIVTDIGQVEVCLCVPGRHMVMNALAAVAAARGMGATLIEIERGLKNFRTMAGRLHAQTALNGACIIDDTYNANPRSVRAALNVLARCSGRKIFVMGDMFELGETAMALHETLGREAKQLGIDCLFGVGVLATSVVEGFGEGAVHCHNKPEVIRSVRHALRRDAAETTVLVKGGRNMAMEDVVEALLC